MKTFRYWIVSCVAIFLLGGSTFADVRKSDIGFVNVGKSEARRVLESNSKNPNFQILDVRTPREYNSGHISKAKLINIYDRDFVERIRQLDRNKTYFVYCGIGYRSSKAHSLMKQLGFKNVYNLVGGITLGFPTPPVR